MLKPPTGPHPNDNGIISSLCTAVLEPADSRVSSTLLYQFVGLTSGRHKHLIKVTEGISWIRKPIGVIYCHSKTGVLAVMDICTRFWLPQTWQKSFLNQLSKDEFMQSAAKRQKWFAMRLYAGFQDKSTGH